MTQLSNQNLPVADGACICGQTLSPQFFRALCDPNRLALLARLAACCGPRTVSELAACCPVDLSVVSRHLAILREAGILEARKQGKEVHYTVRWEAMVRELRAMADAVEQCCAPSAGERRTDEPR